MSDAIDVSEDLTEQESAGDAGRPTSFLPPPTFPAAMLADGGGDPGDDGGGPGEAPGPAPMFAAPPDEGPARPGLLIRLGHLLCGRPNGAR